MATDISCQHGGGEEVRMKKSFITMDLLGECCSKVESKELDLKVPVGWVNYLDINFANPVFVYFVKQAQSGEMYLKRCGSSSPMSSSSTSSDSQQQQLKQNHQRVILELQDLNYPPLTTISAASRLEEKNNLLELKKPISSYGYPCTLDNVKSALERVEKESTLTKKRSKSPPLSIGGSSTSSSTFVKEEGEEKRTLALSLSSSWSPSSTPQSMMLATGCPKCLLYVLISSSNPKCPRCHSIVPSPVAFKKPRIDLNISVRNIDYN
ncbi:hypothetical protein GIB67_028452 [Kingdonia uniflora]|uniref:GIR1-like zinc ribbon domain-containing protein n=1 Tax=Kingdonia uniflora TaxID=39325 RepID=A0A7J7P1U0_9MAGN|nr:hypothetical protein GIB67_028452 [Kingdonia uniflora]